MGPGYFDRDGTWVPRESEDEAIIEALSLIEEPDPATVGPVADEDGSSPGFRDTSGEWLAASFLGESVLDVWDEGISMPAERFAYHRPKKPADTVRHGTRSAYVNDKCRCEPCRHANTAYVQENRRSQKL